METIAICTIKGGAGKTTTAENLASALQNKGYKVLVIDTDGQANLTMHMGASSKAENNLYTLIQAIISKQKYNIEDYIHHTKWEIDIIPGSTDLHEANINLYQVKNWQIVLASALDKVKANYDYCIIDTNPSPHALTKCALYSAQKVVIPMELDISHFQGLADVLELVSQVQKDNKALQVAGIVCLKTALNTTAHKLTHAQTMQYAEAKGINVFNTFIHRASAVEESHIMKQSILEYAPKSKPALDYMALVNELLEE